MIILIVICSLTGLYFYNKTFNELVEFSETRKNALNNYFNNNKSNKSNLKRLRRKIK